MSKDVRRLSRRLTASAIAVVFLGCAALSAEVRETGSQIEALSPSEVLVRLWTYSGKFDEVTLVHVKGSTLYLSGKPHGLDALNVADGSYRFRHLGKYVVEHPPVERMDRIYLVEGGQFVTLNRKTGGEVTRTNTRIGAVAAIFPGVDSWGVCSTDDRIYGIAPETGIKLWRVTLDDHIVDAVWDGGEIIYAMTAKGTLCAVSMFKRNVVWERKLPHPNCSPLTLAGGQIYVGSADYFLYVVSAVSGEILNQVCLSAPVLAKPLVVGDRIYVANNRGVLHAFDITKNAVLWTTPGQRVLTTTPARVALLRTDNGGNVIVVADAATGAVISQVRASRHTFFAADPASGVFFAVAKNGDVLAIADREASEAAKAPAGNGEEKTAETKAEGAPKPDSPQP